MSTNLSNKLFKYIEEDLINDFKESINECSLEDLTQTDSDGFDLISLCVHYNMIDFLEIISEKINNDINNNHNLEKNNIFNSYFSNIISIINKTENFEAFKYLIENNILPISYQNKHKENYFFEFSKNSNFKDFLTFLLEKDISPFSSKNQTDFYFYAIQEKLNEPIDLIHQKFPNLSFEDRYLAQAIKYHNYHCNEYYIDKIEKINDSKLHTKSTYTIDLGKFIESAHDFNNIKFISDVLEHSTFIVGQKNLQHMINLSIKPYSEAILQQSAEKIINYLFEIKLPFNEFINSENKTIWNLVIEYENLPVFKQLLDKVKLSKHDENQFNNPLFYAVYYNKEDFIEPLLRKNANPNQEDDYGNSLVYYAVQNKNPFILEKLLEYGARTNSINRSNETPLSFAIYQRKMELVSPLIWYGSDIVNNTTEISEHHEIANINFNGQYEKNFSYQDNKTINNFVDLSLLGFNLNQKNEDGDTFLLHFIKNGFLNNFLALMKCHINFEQFDKNGNNPLMCAAISQSPIFFNKIIHKFNIIDYNHKNQDGHDIYDICINYKKTDHIIDILNNDNTLNKFKLHKVIQYLIQEKSFSDNFEKIQPFIEKFNIDTFKDSHDNNIYISCLIHKNIKDLNFLLQKKIFNDLNDLNKQGHSFDSIFHNIPQAIKEKIEYNPKNKKHP